jgi:hypothetical protein
VPGQVDHHFLPLEGRVQVRHDANGPRAGAEPQRLGRCLVLAPTAERTRVELLLGGLRELLGSGAGSAATAGSNDSDAARKRVATEVYVDPSALLASAVRRSIGIGNTIVELLLAPISSSVWR